jgi:ubiquinone/menaquinone biosynthesis C-methylase UbiE
MEAQLEKIREDQKDSWNRFSPGWRKWDDLLMDSLKPAGDEIIRLLHAKRNDVVLDVAAGTGEPGLTIAPMLTSGKVVSTDLAEGMLEVAREKASRKGITNFETVRCDVTEMPFDNDTFDAVSCRFGFMFFPDMLLAAKEMVRVMKPGARFATAVWTGPEENLWVTAIMGTLNKHMQLEPPPAGAPGMFRCAEKGSMAELLAKAGLSNIREKEVPGKMNTGTSEQYWHIMTEVAAPVVAALSKADDEMKAKIKKEVIDLINSKYPQGKVSIDSNALIVYGEK